MPQFEYISKDRNSSTIKGRESASSQDELVTKLMRKGLVVISVKEVLEEEASPPQPVHGKGRLKTFDLMVFCRQLATMIKGGIPLMRGIDAITDETKNRVFKNTLLQINCSIREGSSLSASIKKFPRLFSGLFVAIIEAGEKTGALDTMLERLAKYLEARDRINRKILTAITYPSFVVGFFILAMAAMTLFLIPRFKSIYGSFGAELPALTSTVFKISDFFVHNIFFILAVLIISAFSFHRLILKNRKRRYAFDGMILKMPVFGDMMTKASISKFTRTLATLLEQGISITESLALVGKTSGNLVIERASLIAGKLILDGETIPGALKKAKIFPPLMLQMASIGVESGSLPMVLDKTADFYEDEVDVFITVMTSLIEPVLIVTIGAILAFVIVSLYLPIFKLGGAVH